MLERRKRVDRSCRPAIDELEVPEAHVEGLRPAHESQGVYTEHRSVEPREHEPRRADGDSDPRPGSAERHLVPTRTGRRPGWRRRGQPPPLTARSSTRAAARVRSRGERAVDGTLAQAAEREHRARGKRVGAPEGDVRPTRPRDELRPGHRRRERPLPLRSPSATTQARSVRRRGACAWSRRRPRRRSRSGGCSGSVGFGLGLSGASPGSSMRRGSTSPTASRTSRTPVPSRRATSGTPLAPKSSASTPSRITISQMPSPNGTDAVYGSAQSTDSRPSASSSAFAREVTAPEEPVRRAVRRRVRGGEDVVPRRVDDCALLLRVAAPEQEHDPLAPLRELADRPIGERLPALARVGGRLPG